MENVFLPKEFADIISEHYYDEKCCFMKYDIKEIKQIVRSRPATEIIYFWEPTPHSKPVSAACLSQWYDCCFEVGGIVYHTAEQFMMASKALLFDDEKTCREILAAYNPHDCQKLGRRISGYDQTSWDASKYEIVVEGNKAKFSQNTDLKEFLLSTGDAILAEASPHDRIWGIGLDRETAMKGTIGQWQGQNLLGFALMEVRDWLRESEEEKDPFQEMMLLWTLGAGDSAKRFSGVKYMPPKTKVATKDDWHTEPMPDKFFVIPMDITISSEEMRVVRCGHIPETMEDHWFMYCDDGTIRYYRGSGGVCIFIAKYVDDGVNCRITELMVNREQRQYSGTDIDTDVSLFLALLTEEYNGDASEYWIRVLK